MGRGSAKSNSLNKTPEIKSHFRKNENAVAGTGVIPGSGHQPKLHQNQGNFLGTQAGMIIRGRSDKQAHSVLQQYASHELPSVIVNK